VDVQGYQIEFRRDVLHFTFSTSTNPQALGAALNVVADLFTERGPRRFGIITDVSHRRASSVDGRRLIADFLQRQDAYLKSHCRGWAVVTNNDVIRGALTAILWFKALPCPYRIMETSRAAEVWLARRAPLTGQGQRAQLT